MTPRTHQPHWKDTTRTARSAKRTKQDDQWANDISGGRYPTLRKLMTAVHNGEIILKEQDNVGALVNEMIEAVAKKGKS